MTIRAAASSESDGRKAPPIPGGGDPNGNGGGGHGVPPGELEMYTEGDTLFVAGDIDLYQAPAFRAAAESHIATVAQPRFDLTDVPFLDSAGLATLLYLSRLAGEQGKTLRMLVSGGPRRVLKITGIDRVLVLDD